MDWQIATQTHVGKVRKLNEDSLLVVKDYPLLAVADGMGGHQAGEIASAIIVDNLAKLNLSTNLNQAREQAEHSLLASNREIIDFGNKQLNGVSAGSTIITLLAQEQRAVCLWAGDSRLYRMRHDTLEQLSEDHSYVSEMVRDGLLSPEQAVGHPSSNMITRAIGILPDISIATMTLDVEDGDTYLLCSDGLYNELDDGEIQQLLTNGDVYRCSVQLLNKCLERAAKDNITFIIGHAVDRSSSVTCESEETQFDAGATRI
jgi:serine/threonine protein phosphatase PrpC